MELAQYHYLAGAFERCQRGIANDVGDLLGGNACTRALDLAHVGVLAGDYQSGIARLGVV